MTITMKTRNFARFVSKLYAIINKGISRISIKDALYIYILIKNGNEF